ncbi:NDR1/HIN1-like protein 26 [Bienertia sinuspersici]
MTSKSQPTYSPLPSEPNSRPPTTTVNYVILPNYPSTRHRYLRRILLPFSLLLLLTFSLFILFPSNPDLKLSRIELNHIQINSSHHLSLDLSLSLTLKVRNPDFFSLNYNSLDVSIAYRGKELGFVKSNGGRVKARGSSYVDATLVVDGFEVIHDFFYLIEDFAAGKVPFDTVSNIKGHLGLFFLHVPIQGSDQIGMKIY